MVQEQGNSLVLFHTLLKITFVFPFVVFASLFQVAKMREEEEEDDDDDGPDAWKDLQ